MADGCRGHRIIGEYLVCNGGRHAPTRVDGRPMSATDHQAVQALRAGARTATAATRATSHAPRQAHPGDALLLPLRSLAARATAAANVATTMAIRAEAALAAIRDVPPEIDGTPKLE